MARKAKASRSSSVSSGSTAYSVPAGIWFDDGNVVVIAQDQSFRVNEGILSRRSQTLRQMIKDARRPNQTEIELRVTDSAHDFKHLLHILYDGFEYTKPSKPTTFSDLASAVRLAHKYSIFSVLNLCFDELIKFFPSTLDDWDKLASLRALDSPSWSPANAIEAVILLGALPSTGPAGSMLPTARYLAAQLPPETLFRGVPRAGDGALEILGDHPGVAEDILALQNTLRKHAIGAHGVVYDPGVPKGCKAGVFTSCKDALERAEKDHRPAAVHTDPLGCALRVEIAALGGDEYKVCAPCISALKMREEEHRKNVWSELCGTVEGCAPRAESEKPRAGQKAK